MGQDTDRVTRRYADKILAGACVVIVSLLGIIWGTVASSIKTVEAHETRISVLEEKVKWLDRLEKKIDSVLEVKR